MILSILRGVFILLAVSVALLYILGAQEGLQAGFGEAVIMMAVSLGLSIIVIAVDILTPQKKLSAVSGVFLGLGAGLLAAFAFSFVIDLIGVVLLPDIGDLKDKTPEGLATAKEQLNESNLRALAYWNLLKGVKVIVGLITCYIGITLVLQTKDDFRFVIPYVEFAKQIRGNRPIILDTSVIIDGRIIDIIDTNILQGTIIIPRFVLNELQFVADSPDKLKRLRGRRGLDMLQKLQENTMVETHIEEADAEGANVDQKLIALSHDVKARLMTNDFNLKKVAELRGVDIINLNDLVAAMHPVVLPGEQMKITIQKKGEGQGQGVGYLDDGTMVVVENTKKLVGENIEFTVTSNYQTSAGRMIFGQYEKGYEQNANDDKTSDDTVTSKETPQTNDGNAAPPTQATPRESNRNSNRNPRRNA